MLANQKRLIRKITLTFVAALLILAVVTIISQKHMHKAITARVSDSEVINMSGMQRTYSQKIVKTALVIAITRDSVERKRRMDELKLDAAAWDEALQELVEGELLKGFESSKDTVWKLIQLKRPHHEAMLNAVQDIIATENIKDPAIRTYLVQQALDTLLLHDPFVLKYRNGITELYKREANAKIISLDKKESLMAILTLMVLALQAAFIYTPAVKLIKNFLREQHNQIKELNTFQEELFKLNAFQNAILRSASVSIISTDINGFITGINQTASTWLGYSPEEVVGQYTPIIMHKAEEIWQHAAELSAELQTEIAPGFGSLTYKAQHGLPEMREWSFVRKDGSSFTALLTVSAIIGNDNLIKGFLGVSHDISEKKKAEDELKKSEQVYRLISENSKDIISVTTPEGVSIYLSPSVKEVTGYEPDELINLSIFNYFHAEDRKRIKKQAHELTLKGETLKQAEYRAKVKAGHYIWLETVIKPILDKEGNIILLQSSSRDITKRKQAEEKLIAVSHLLSGVLDSSLSGIMAFKAIRDKKTGIADFEWILVNKGAESLINRTADSLIGKRLLQEMPGNKTDGMFDMYIRVVETGEALNFEHCYEDNGNKKCLHTVAVKLDDGLAVTFSDITERKKAEADLIKSNQLIHALFDHSPISIQIFDKQGKSFRMNEARKKYDRLSSADTHLENYSMHADPFQQAAGVSTSFQQAYQGEIVTVLDQCIEFAYDNSALPENGKKLYYDQIIFPIKNDSGEVEAVVSFIQDVTYKMIARLEMEETQHFIESIANTIPNCLYVFDIQTYGIVYANRELALMLGYSETQLESMGDQFLRQIVHPDDLLKLMAYYKNCRSASDDMYHIEFRVKNYQQEYRLLQTRDVPFKRNQANEVIQMVGIAQDITDKREAELKLQQTYRELQASEKELRRRGKDLVLSNENLERTLRELKSAQAQLVQSEKMASLGQLTAGIAHEINNPINFVYAGVDNLSLSLKELYQIMDKYEEIERQAARGEVAVYFEGIQQLKQDLFYKENREIVLQTLQSIENGASRTAEIVKGLRNFSRLDEAVVKKADVHEGIESTLILLRSQIKDRITVTRKYEKSLPRIDCYPGQLNQVFMNILTNAIQAISDRGEIIIETQNFADTIQIAFADSGAGMPAEVQDRIFDPFFTTKDIGQGTGLGLSITYGIIQKHKGSIQVRSKLGKGTTFTMLLPKSF